MTWKACSPEMKGFYWFYASRKRRIRFRISWVHHVRSWVSTCCTSVETLAKISQISAVYCSTISTVQWGRPTEQNSLWDGPIGQYLLRFIQTFLAKHRDQEWPYNTREIFKFTANLCGQPSIYRKALIIPKRPAIIPWVSLAERHVCKEETML